VSSGDGVRPEMLQAGVINIHPPVSTDTLGRLIWNVEGYTPRDALLDDFPRVKAPRPRSYPVSDPSQNALAAFFTRTTAV